MSDPLLDARDIQGNIIPGFARSQLWIAAVKAQNSRPLVDLLRTLSPHVTPATQTYARRMLRKMAFLNIEQPPSDDPLWLNIALTKRGLEQLQIGGVSSLDTAFDVGMLPTRTGDPTAPLLSNGQPNPGAPDNWLIGGPKHPFDALLLFSGDEETRQRSVPLIEGILRKGGIDVVYEESGQVLDGNTEHFGFADGLSQPGVYGEFQINGVWTHITARYGIPSSNGIEYGKPGQPLVWPGQFIVGAPRSKDDPGETVDPIAKNGSFLVFRRLRQDVSAFYSDTDRLATSLASVVNFPQLTGELLRTLIVGRWPSGEPLMRSGWQEPMATEPHLCLNYFLFQQSTPELKLDTGEMIKGVVGDFAGRLCPHWAHIRKVNPRDMQTDQDDPTQTLQMLRRGFPFGPPYDHLKSSNPQNQEERGLLFLAYQRSLERQFEVLNSDWMNQFQVPVGGGYDLLVGQHTTAGSEDARPVEWPATRQIVTAQRNWVIPTGGEYLFAPSISAIRRMTS